MHDEMDEIRPGQEHPPSFTTRLVVGRVQLRGDCSGPSTRHLDRYTQQLLGSRGEAGRTYYLLDDATVKPSSMEHDEKYE